MDASLKEIFLQLAEDVQVALLERRTHAVPEACHVRPVLHPRTPQGQPRPNHTSSLPGGEQLGADEAHECLNCCEADGMEVQARLVLTAEAAVGTHFLRTGLEHQPSGWGPVPAIASHTRALPGTVVPLSYINGQAEVHKPEARAAALVVNLHKDVPSMGISVVRVGRDVLEGSSKLHKQLTNEVDRLCLSHPRRVAWRCRSSTSEKAIQRFPWKTIHGQKDAPGLWASALLVTRDQARKQRSLGSSGAARCSSRSRTTCQLAKNHALFQSCLQSMW